MKESLEVTVGVAAICLEGHWFKSQNKALANVLQMQGKDLQWVQLSPKSCLNGSFVAPGCMYANTY